MYLITQALQQPLSEVPNWDKLPFDILVGLLAHKAKEHEQIEKPIKDEMGLDFEWHDPEVQL